MRETGGRRFTERILVEKLDPASVIEGMPYNYHGARDGENNTDETSSLRKNKIKWYLGSLASLVKSSKVEYSKETNKQGKRRGLCFETACPEPQNLPRVLSASSARRLHGHHKQA